MSIGWLERVISNCSGILLTCLQPRQGILSWWYPQKERLEVQRHCSRSDLWCSSPVPAPIWPQCYILPGSGSKYGVSWCLLWVCAVFEICSMLKEAPEKAWKLQAQAQKWKLFKYVHIYANQKHAVRITDILRPNFLRVLWNTESFAT